MRPPIYTNIKDFPLFLLLLHSQRCFLSPGSVSLKGDASDEDDDNEFFDAMQDPAEFITVPADPKYHRSAVVTVAALSSALFLF